MNAITALAREIEKRSNPSPYTPMLGKITALPELQVRLGSRILLDKSDIKAIFDIYETEHTDHGDVYVNLNKEIVLLPYANDNKFIAIGVIQ